MALILKDRVKESSASSGTGNITLGGAFPGYQTFNAAIATGSTVYYTIHNLAAGFDTEWEVGVGTFTSPATLSRDTVLSSSTGSKVNFTGGTEGLEVFVTQPAEEAVYINQATGKVEVFGNGTNVVAFTEINTTNLTANTVTLTAGTISTNASNATDIVNKQYVDGIVAAGVHYHEPVLVETPTALTATYNQPGGAGNGVGATLTNSGANVALVIDGVSLSNTARVLVYQQSNAVQNGVYTVTNPGAPDTPGPGAQWVLTRATDADTYVIASSAGLSEGSTVFVQSGNTGAGETYTCNTPGVITFGSTNITFAQISSAQVYSAGTGLSLTNTVFSISNTAVTAATYDGAGNTVSLTVNAQGQLTNVASVPINASAITLGTLSNDRTTANSANGASTIIARDANGSFTANVITATDVNSTNVTATTGSFTNISGNAATVTNINASNISSGTLDNARTTGNTANSASTIVLRDASGNFGSNVITASSFSGDGTAITAINASNISSGTIANARTTADSANGASTIVSRDAGGNFAANTITANFSGNGATVTDINASNITSGTISNARTTASSANGASTIVLRDTNGSFSANVVNADSFSGNGVSITAVNASNLTSGTVPTARVSGSYTGITGVGTVTAGTWQGNAVGVSYGGTGTSTQFTAGSVVFAGTSGVYSQDNSNLFWDDTNNNLGIGTNAPTSTAGFVPRLQLTSSASTGLVITSTASTQQNLIGTNGSGFFVESVGSATATDNNIIFRTNSTNSNYGGIERMRITSAGDVGIGTTAPRTQMMVLGSAQTTSAITDAGSQGGTLTLAATNNAVGGGGALLFSALNDIGTYVPQWAIKSLLFNGTNNGTGALAFSGRAAGSDTNLTERMRLHSTGGVSIGNTTDPGAANLSVTGTIAGNGAPLTALNASNLASGTVATGRISGSYTGITGVGTLTAGTWQGTSISTTYTDAKVTSVNAGTGISVNQTTGAVTVSIGQAVATSSNVQFNSIGVNTAGSGTAGEIRATNNITAFYSDERLKTKTGDIENALDKVCQIETMLYHANETAVALGYDASIPEVGVTAQSVQKVQPEVVVPAPIDDKYLTVRYEKLVPLLIEAIKELKAEVDALKGK
jgi:hypothetical protein